MSWDAVTFWDVFSTLHATRQVLRWSPFGDHVLSFFFSQKWLLCMKASSTINLRSPCGRLYVAGVRGRLCGSRNMGLAVEPAGCWRLPGGQGSQGRSTSLKYCDTSEHSDPRTQRKPESFLTQGLDGSRQCPCSILMPTLQRYRNFTVFFFPFAIFTKKKKKNVLLGL